VCEHVAIRIARVPHAVHVTGARHVYQLRRHRIDHVAADCAHRTTTAHVHAPRVAFARTHPNLSVASMIMYSGTPQLLLDRRPMHVSNARITERAVSVLFYTVCAHTPSAIGPCLSGGSGCSNECTHSHKLINCGWLIRRNGITIKCRRQCLLCR
jgi:hypothetical protein